jgi:hypothetical protein
MRLHPDICLPPLHACSVRGVGCTAKASVLLVGPEIGLGRELGHQPLVGNECVACTHCAARLVKVFWAMGERWHTVRVVEPDGYRVPAGAALRSTWNRAHCFGAPCVWRCRCACCGATWLAGADYEFCGDCVAARGGPP